MEAPQLRRSSGRRSGSAFFTARHMGIAFWGQLRARFKVFSLRWTLAVLCWMTRRPLRALCGEDGADQGDLPAHGVGAVLGVFFLGAP
jgi:hypothetical protein